jgi:hypothetical protein
MQKIKAKIIWWEFKHAYLCGPLYKKAHNTEVLYIKSLPAADNNKHRIQKNTEEKR